MSTKVHPAATPTEGETKAPATTTGSAEASALSLPVTILKDVFNFPDHIPKDLLPKRLIYVGWRKKEICTTTTKVMKPHGRRAATTACKVGSVMNVPTARLILVLRVWQRKIV
jgi:hypothetical protein